MSTLKTQTLHYEEYLSWDELKPEDRVLLEDSLRAADRAYAPYSKFKVGCALRGQNGKILLGSNQENIVYKSSCAERVTLNKAATEGHLETGIESIAITGNSAEPKPIVPCGSCRQDVLEWELQQKTPIRIILGSTEHKTVWIFTGVKELYPFSFEDLNLQ